MCGIAGFTHPGPRARAILSAMNRAQAHRGPDAEGGFVDRGVAFGHRRLAVIDLAGGAQPRVDAGTGDALIFNGEIFGHQRLAADLRARGVVLRDRSDTEVLFQLIRSDGLRAALARIDGQFAFAFRDGRGGALHLVRDRFGEKPLFYAVVGGQLVFASEVSALRAHPALAEMAPDRLAAFQLLLFEYLPGTASGWEGVAKLPPGCVLTWKDGQARVEQYWQPAGETTDNVSAADAAERLDGLLFEAVRDRVVADVPVGVFLSGGLDSSLITALAMQAAPRIAAFTVRIGGEGFDEAPHAARVAAHLGVRHEVVTLGDADLIAALDAITGTLSDPLADSSLLPTYLVCRAARARMTVALGGDGADELFAGYPNFRAQRFSRAMALLPAPAGRLLRGALARLPPGAGYMNRRFLAAQLSHGFGAAPHRQSSLWMAPFDPESLLGLWRAEALPANAMAAAFAPIDRLAAEAAGRGAVGQLLHLFLTTYLPDDILAKTDRASMFNGLEVRAPFLDRAVAAYVCALPTRLKLGGGGQKRILKRVARRYLPDEIVDRKKHGFAVPIGHYLRGLFRERCRDVLLSASNPVAGWFHRPAIEAMLAAHIAGRQDFGKKLWALYVLFAVAGRPAGAAAVADEAA